MGNAPKAILWGKNGCERCRALKRRLAGCQLEIRPIEAARAAEDPLAIEVMAQLAWQDRKLPVVMADEESMEPEGLLTQSCEGVAGSCMVNP